MWPLPVSDRLPLVRTWLDARDAVEAPSEKPAHKHHYVLRRGNDIKQDIPMGLMFLVCSITANHQSYLTGIGEMA